MLFCFAVGCGKPSFDFSNNRYAEFVSVQDLKAKPLNTLGFHIETLDVYLPVPASATKICICEESGIDSSFWWAFDVSDADFPEIEKIAKGNSPCPFTPKKHEKTFTIPKEAIGVHSKDKMIWIGIDPNTKRIYCLKYTM